MAKDTIRTIIVLGILQIYASATTITAESHAFGSSGVNHTRQHLHVKEFDSFATSRSLAALAVSHAIKITSPLHSYHVLLSRTLSNRILYCDLISVVIPNEMCELYLCRASWHTGDLMRGFLWILMGTLPTEWCFTLVLPCLH